MKWMSFLTILGILATVSCRTHRLKQDAEPMLKHLDRRVEYLKLDASQEARYQSIREKLKADVEAHMAARNESVRQLKAEYQKTDPNVAGQMAQIKQAMQERQSAFLRLPDYYAEFYSILNADQKARLNEKFRDRLDRMKLPDED